MVYCGVGIIIKPLSFKDYLRASQATDVGSIPIARSMSPAVCIRQTLRDIRTPLFRAWIPVEMPGECQGWTSLRKHPSAGSVVSECILAHSLQDRNSPAPALWPPGPGRAAGFS